jgi:dTDP-glucose 4,6-dehydratase
MHPYFAGKTVVVTGAAGFVGSHLCDHLLESGAEVYGVDNFITGQERNLAHLQGNPHFHFIKADVNDDPRSYLSMGKIDLILHFASPASPPLYQKYPVETYLVNSHGTHQLLQFLKQHHPTARFLFASTSEVYGNPQEHPQVEGYWGNVNPVGPRGVYDEAKRYAEALVMAYHRVHKIPVRIVRIFNTYGPRMRPNDGRAIPAFISQALANKPVTVFGKGSQTN